MATFDDAAARLNLPEVDINDGGPRHAVGAHQLEHNVEDYKVSIPKRNRVCRPSIALHIG